MKCNQGMGDRRIDTGNPDLATRNVLFCHIANLSFDHFYQILRIKFELQAALAGADVNLIE